MYQLSVIIPCYNEQNSINKLVERCLFITKDRKDIEFLFVNNGSTDKTAMHLYDLISSLNFANAKIVEVPMNKGYGYGIKCGIEASNSQILAWTHADLQTDPNDVITAFDKYKYEIIESEILVKGNRHNRPFFDNIFTKGMSFLCTKILGVKLDDVNAQPKLFNKKLANIVLNGPNDFLLDLYFLYNIVKNGYKLKTMPVYFSNRQFGKAKGAGSIKGKIRISFITIKYILKLKKSEIK
jgi:glycosyltransferase involved in cell wall biosynthesis